MNKMDHVCDLAEFNGKFHPTAEDTAHCYYRAWRNQARMYNTVAGQSISAPGLAWRESECG